MDYSLVGLLRASVERYPDKRAVEYQDEAISYGELWRQAGALAGQLLEHDLQPGDRVAVLIENSPAYVVSYYAVLMAGGTVVGLNTAARSHDIGNWIRHSGARFLIIDGTHAECDKVLAQVSEQLRMVVELWREPAGPKTIGWSQALSAKPHLPAPLDRDQARRACASIVYTSGTTGSPKGVMLSHGNLYANIVSIVEYLGLREDDSIVNLLPFYYTYGNSVLHTHLAVGASLVLENSLLYPHAVMEKISERRASGFSGVPSTFNLLLNRVDLGAYDLAGLRYITQAGGHMLPANIQRVRELIPHARFFVMYGQTEACSRLSYLPPERLEQKLGSIGIPIPGVELDIWDAGGKPLPVRKTGEVCARGDNIMLGYWNDSEASTRVLVDGWLRTGDLGYRDEDGYIFLVGRSSEMIKSGAHRISPADIEEVINEVEGVEEVAVVGISDDLLGQVVKAVVVMAPDAAIGRMDIMRHCKQRLANYKLPRVVEFSDHIPRTASGKIQKFKLTNTAE